MKFTIVMFALLVVAASSYGAFLLTKHLLWPGLYYTGKGVGRLAKGTWEWISEIPTEIIAIFCIVTGTITGVVGGVVALELNENFGGYAYEIQHEEPTDDGIYIVQISQLPDPLGVELFGWTQDPNLVFNIVYDANKDSVALPKNLNEHLIKVRREHWAEEISFLVTDLEYQGALKQLE